MATRSIPSVLLSRTASGAALGVAGPAKLPITAVGTTYTMAQEATWLDDDHYAVGRWDGSLSIFNFTASSSQGPIIEKAVNSPSHEGMQMIALSGERNAFVSSNDEKSLVIWRSADGSWQDLLPAATLPFAPEFGVANSGCLAVAGTQNFFVAGHANGRVTIWCADKDPQRWSCVATIDVRSPRPTNPWGLANVRGIAPLPGDGTYGYVVAGSEDGNLTVVRVPDGKIMSAVVYNSAAQRGINSVATSATNVLVTNCAVGASDRNLWSYKIEPGTWTISNIDSANLVVDPKALQVFNFDVTVAPVRSGEIYAFCSTEEGALWLVKIADDGKLAIIGHEVVTQKLGSALCFRNGKLALTAYDLKEYTFDG